MKEKQQDFKVAKYYPKLICTHSDNFLLMILAVNLGHVFTYSVQMLAQIKPIPQALKTYIVPTCKHI